MSFLNDLFGGSESSSTQQISPTQLPFLKNLWQQGQQQAGAIQGQVPQYQQQGQQFLGQLQGQGQQLNPFIGEGFTQGQIGGLQQLLNRNLSENLLPAIGQGANAMGQLGGARQGVAQGIALRGTQEALGRGAIDIYQQDLARRQQAAGMQGGLQNQASAIGLQGIPGVMNLGLSPLSSLAGIIGSPTVLNRSFGENTTGVLFQAVDRQGAWVAVWRCAAWAGALMTCRVFRRSER